MPRRLVHAVPAAALVVLPRLALACPVCMAADARRMDAYVATTALLSLLPLAAIGGIAWLIWRRANAGEAGAPVTPPRDRDETTRRPPPRPRLRPEP
ncbi:hypothetical protein KF840_18975 [bacterium]|nr:hypothetical protein [bacterium]